MCLNEFAQQVALEVEQEEDEAGTIGDTFTDYVSELVTAGNMTFLIQLYLCICLKYVHYILAWETQTTEALLDFS